MMSPTTLTSFSPSKSSTESTDVMKLPSVPKYKPQEVVTIRFFVLYKGDMVTLDVEENDTIYEVKERVREIFHIGPDEGPSGADEQEKKLLTLVYGGADLQNDWVLADIGLSQGLTIKAVLKDEIKPSMYIYCAFNHETVPILQQIHVLDMTVSEFRGIVSRKVGLPVGAFRIVNRVTGGMEMFDCHLLDVYGLTLGGTVRVETWDGWNDFLNFAIMGYASHMMNHLSTREVVSRYQLKVAMYIAGHFGHVDLAVSLLRQGIRADEAIRIHPLRQWCQQAIEHIDSLKTPIHEAAEAGQLGVLRSMVHHNLGNVMAKDGNGLTPLNIALRNRQKPCASFLLTKQWSKISYNKKTSLPLSLYVKMKRWCEQARERVLVIHGQFKSSLKNPKRPLPAGALVTYGVQLDGFSKSKLSSKSSMQVKAEEEYEERRKRPVFDFSHEDMPEDEITPDVYFKSLSMIQTLKLPRLSRIGKMLTRVAEQERKRLISDSESQRGGGDTTPSINGLSQSPELRRKSRPKSGSQNQQAQALHLPPIQEKLKREAKGLSASHQNLTTHDKSAEFDNDIGNPGKARSLYLKTGSVSPTGVKKATSLQSILEGEKPNDKPTGDFGNKDAYEKTPHKKKERPTRSATLLAKSRTGDGAIPLPANSFENNPRPFIRSRSEDLTLGTLRLYEKYRGQRSRDYALRCLTVANSFKEKPWLQQVQQAMAIARKGVKRVSRQNNMYHGNSNSEMSLSAAMSMETSSNIGNDAQVAMSM